MGKASAGLIRGSGPLSPRLGGGADAPVIGQGACQQAAISHHACVAGCLGVTLIFLLALTHYAPPSMVGWERPVFNLDYPGHFYNAANAYDSFHATGHLVGGYIPYFMAGYPFLEPVSSRPMELTAALFGGAGLVRVFNVTIFLMVYSGPLLIWWYVAGAAPSRAGQLVLLPIMLSCFMLKMMYMVSVGLVSYAICILACGVLVVRFHKLCARFTWGELTLNCLLGVCCLLLHASAGLMCLVPCCVIVAKHALGKRFLPLGLAAVVGAATLAGNAFWWVPVVVHGDLLSPLAMDPFGHGGDTATQIVAVLVLLLASGGLTVWRRVASGGPADALYAGGVALLLIAAFGAEVPILGESQPGRYRAAGVFFLLPHVGVLLSRALGQFCGPSARGRCGRIHVGAAAVLCAVGLAALPARGLSTLREVDPEGRVPELCAFIREHTDRSARILMEEAVSAIQPHVQQEAPLGAFASGYIARATQRNMIGGPHQTIFLRHHYASFFGGLLFRRPIGEYGEEELRELFKTYNIHWVYCWSDAAREALGRCRALLRPTGAVGPYETFEVAVEPSFVLGGTGRVEARVGHIRVSGADQPVTLLKFHWCEGLQSTPPLPVGPRRIEGAELPFIEIRNGDIRDFTIHQ